MEIPDTLKPFQQLGVELVDTRGSSAKAHCLFCDREEKFAIKIDTGQFQCWSCQVKGNVVSFLRQLYDLLWKENKSTRLQELADLRSIPLPTLTRWGVVWNPFVSQFVVPTFGKENKVNNLYRWAKIASNNGHAKRALFGAKGLGAGLFGVQLRQKKHKVVYLTEGPWDGMALDAAIFEDKGNTLPYGDIFSLPGGGVFKEEWNEYVIGKEVVIMFDNDHPRKNDRTGQLLPPFGWTASEKLVKQLKNRASMLSVLRWGEEGYTRDRPDGYDIRDLLTQES